MTQYFVKGSFYLYKMDLLASNNFSFDSKDADINQFVSFNNLVALLSFHILPNTGQICPQGATHVNPTALHTHVVKSLKQLNF